MSSDDDDVPQRPEDAQFRVPIFHTRTACAGAVTAYLLRRIAYRAGAYAPGIDETIFHELNTTRYGGLIDNVQGWFAGRSGYLNELGYRLQARRVVTPTATLLDWVRAGRGYRATMMPTAFRRLHPQPGAGGGSMPDDSVAHAVGVIMDRLDLTSEPPAKADDDLVMIDPWPGVVGDAKERDKLHPDLELAQRDRGFHALVFYWAGWS